MSFDKIFDLTAGVYFYFYNIYLTGGMAATTPAGPIQTTATSQGGLRGRRNKRALPSPFPQSSPLAMPVEMTDAAPVYA